MESSGNRKGFKLDDEMSKDAEALERSGRESHVEEFREQEGAEGETGSGHRVAGTGSSADRYSYQDHGEEGGASHPKPKGDEGER